MGLDNGEKLEGEIILINLQEVSHVIVANP